MQASITNHRLWLDNKKRVFLGGGAEDVTGDGVPDYLYRSSGEGCVSCHATYISVFIGDKLIFDEGTFNDATVTIMPDHLGFVVTERILGQGESSASASGRGYYTYRFNGSAFMLTDKTANVPPTAIPPTPTIKASYQAGVWQRSFWTWKGLPMPAGVYFITDSGTFTGFWMQGTDSSIRSWFAEQLLPYGLRLNLSSSRRDESGWLRTKYCIPNGATAFSTGCVTVSTLTRDRFKPGETSPYSAEWTLVTVNDYR